MKALTRNDAKPLSLIVQINKCAWLAISGSESHQYIYIPNVEYSEFQNLENLFYFDVANFVECVYRVFCLFITGTH